MAKLKSENTITWNPKLFIQSINQYDYVENGIESFFKLNTHYAIKTNLNP